MLGRVSSILVWQELPSILQNGRALSSGFALTTNGSDEIHRPAIRFRPWDRKCLYIYTRYVVDALVNLTCCILCHSTWRTILRPWTGKPDVEIVSSKKCAAKNIIERHSDVLFSFEMDYVRNKDVLKWHLCEFFSKITIKTKYEEHPRKGYSLLNCDL